MSYKFINSAGRKVKNVRISAREMEVRDGGAIRYSVLFQRDRHRAAHLLQIILGLITSVAVAQFQIWSLFHPFLGPDFIFMPEVSYLYSVFHRACLEYHDWGAAASGKEPCERSDPKKGM